MWFVAQYSYVTTWVVECDRRAYKGEVSSSKLRCLITGDVPVIG